LLLAFESCFVAGSESAVEGFHRLPFTVDAACRYQVFDETDSRRRGLEDLPRFVDATRVHQVMDGPFRARDERQHEAAVPTRRSVSDPRSLEEHDSALGEAFGKVQRGGQAGIAAADDDYVGGVVALQRSERQGVLNAGRLDPVTMRSRPEERASGGAVPLFQCAPADDSGNTTGRRSGCGGEERTPRRRADSGRLLQPRRSAVLIMSAGVAHVGHLSPRTAPALDGWLGPPP
jgi:hypothetical protein